MGIKLLSTAYKAGIAFGLCGGHHFYLGRKLFGVVYVCTFGLFGIGYIYDLIRMRWLVKHVNSGSSKAMLSDCYLLCAIGGWFGLHHFYLGNKKLGIFWACTLGVFGIGWIGDLFRMKNLIDKEHCIYKDRSLGTARILALSPFGIFGAQHFYLKRNLNGALYACTFGLLGIGWILDWLRIQSLVQRYKDKDQKKILCEAYMYWFFPFGLFGLHQFYLGNKTSGTIYACSLGMLLVGWIMDAFLLPGLVREYNKNITYTETESAPAATDVRNGLSLIQQCV